MLVFWQGFSKCQPGVKTHAAPWTSQAWQCGVLPWIKQRSQKHATVTTTADGLLPRYHRVWGGSSQIRTWT